MIRFITLLLPLVLFCQCSKTSSPESSSTRDTSSIKTNEIKADIATSPDPSQQMDTAMVIFEGRLKDFYSFERQPTIVFEDVTAKREISFSHFSNLEQMKSLELFHFDETNYAYSVQNDKVGKRYRVTYKTEMNDDNGAAEMMPTDRLLSVVPL